MMIEFIRHSPYEGVPSQYWGFNMSFNNLIFAAE
jgi:hypothetical protein